jgi:D-alanyl-D-alanine carboxypeptidase
MPPSPSPKTSPGTEENFARVMTDTARSIGMNATTFRNASGLPNEDQITTARDMATLAAHLIHDYPEYYGVFETRYFTFNGHKYRNHNKLLFGYQGCDGIKTGYTKASGFNLTASVHRGNKHLVAVVLGGKTGGQRDAAMRSLLDRHFAKATDTKPTPAQLLASLVPAPSPPAVQNRPIRLHRQHRHPPLLLLELPRLPRIPPPTQPPTPRRAILAIRQSRSRLA